MINLSEQELLRGTMAGFFKKPPIVLTTKRLIIGEESINLDDILEVYAQQESIKTKMIVRLKSGDIRECVICPEKKVSALTTFGGTFFDIESESRANSKATVDRWVNLINRYLK